MEQNEKLISEMMECVNRIIELQDELKSVNFKYDSKVSFIQDYAIRLQTHINDCLTANN